MKKEVELYSVCKDVECLNCKGKGAIQSYGLFYPNGVGELADKYSYHEKNRNTPYISNSFGFGGTIPYECMNCGSVGLIDYGGLEGYKQAFKTIDKDKL